MTVVSHPARAVALPRWPTFMLGTYATLATLSLAQAIVDVALPAWGLAQPFGFLFEMTQRLGPGFFFLYILVHNLGLACIVPGFGFVAVWFEKQRANRFVVALLLGSAVCISLLVALEYILQAQDRFVLALALPLWLGESMAVLALTVASVREFRNFVPTPAYAWSLVTPLRNLSFPFLVVAALLALMSAIETAFLFGS